jgi:SP family general alpha glucoside:H+ symporter-like MFS transporter
MEGFDVSIFSSYWGHPWFLKRFGELQPDGTYVANANWQAACGNATNVGSIIGLAINAFCQYNFGSKRTYLVTMVVMTLVIFVPVFATNIYVLFAGSLLMGIPWGVFQVLTTAYAAELCPMAVRAHLTSFVNICWACGLFIGSGVVRATLGIDGFMSYRLPYMLQWVWPVPLFLCALFAPESPWFLVRKGRFDDARRALRKTARKGYFSEGELDAQVALMRHTLEMEKSETNSQSLLNCFRGSNLRRTEIVCCSEFHQSRGADISLRHPDLVRPADDRPRDPDPHQGRHGRRPGL